MVIGHDVWIGEGATILSGVTVGDGAVIAANATVVRDVGAYEIWGENPARHLRARFTPDVTARLQALAWWTRDLEQIRVLTPLLLRHPDDTTLTQMEQIVTQ